MKTLVVYYSRSGHNEKLAQELAKKLEADLEHIIDTKNRKGALGWIIGGKDASFKKPTIIETSSKNPSEYDMVVFLSPLWVGTVAPALRQYITENKAAFKKIAFASVNGGGDAQKSIQDVESLSGYKLSSTLYFSETQFNKGDYHSKLNSFIESLKN